MAEEKQTGGNVIGTAKDYAGTEEKVTKVIEAEETTEDGE